MRKNVASQVIAAQLVDTSGVAVTSGTTTVYVLGDGGTQGSGGGTVTHEGQGCWSYAPTQAETNYNHIAFTFTNSSAVPATVQVYTTSLDPHDTVRNGLTALPNASPAANGGLPTVNANNRIVGIQGTKNTLDDLNDISAGDLNNLSAAQVNTELTNVLNTSTWSELTATPNYPVTILDMLRFMYLLSRHKLNQTSSQLAIRNTADDTDVATATVQSDSVTFTRGSFS